MTSLSLGALSGVIFGIITVLLMIPLKFKDKRAAIVGAFINRFAIGFVIGATLLPLPGWARGLFFGFLLSLPDALITKAYIPILVIGALGGLLIGIVVSVWGM
jgi:hypothetical protein